jgi:hypothetical protein
VQVGLGVGSVAVGGRAGLHWDAPIVREWAKASCYALLWKLLALDLVLACLSGPERWVRPRERSQDENRSGG